VIYKNTVLILLITFFRVFQAGVDQAETQNQNGSGVSGNGNGIGQHQNQQQNGGR
jgi:hypothetical protein